MRTIKFRAWNEEHKMMSEPFTLEQLQGCKAYFVGSIFQQFTGLLDKNGKEIYEGDIVQTPNYDYDPSNGDNPYDISEIKWGNTGWIINDYGSNEDVEIIGNIYENPELI